MAVQVGGFLLKKPLLLWINDGLMAVFFLLVGLEVKREVLEGGLSEPSKAILPVLAAIGGMVVPASIYVLLNWGDLQDLRGWAIPTATDIAFALGVLSLVGSRVPPSLRIFLLAVAIIDDLGAILIIALFYTGGVSWIALAFAAAGIAALAVFNLTGVIHRAPYILAGVFLWVCVLKSGIHATLAGVVVGMAVPLQNNASRVAVAPFGARSPSLGCVRGPARLRLRQCRRHAGRDHDRGTASPGRTRDRLWFGDRQTARHCRLGLGGNPFRASEIAGRRRLAPDLWVWRCLPASALR